MIDDLLGLLFFDLSLLELARGLTTSLIAVVVVLFEMSVCISPSSVASNALLSTALAALAAFAAFLGESVVVVDSSKTFSSRLRQSSVDGRGVHPSAIV